MFSYNKQVCGDDKCRCASLQTADCRLVKGSWKI